MATTTQEAAQFLEETVLQGNLQQLAGSIRIKHSSKIRRTEYAEAIL